MTDKYNGWANYATWRVNLEMIDGLEPSDMGWSNMAYFDLADAIHEYCDQVLEDQVQGKSGGMSLIYSYAQAFLSDVRWTEIAERMIDDFPDDFESEEEEGESA